MRGQSLYDYCMEHEDKKYLLDEWDYEKNEKELGISLKDVSRGSHNKVWWKCTVCNNSWLALSSSRVRGYGCPECGKKKAGTSRSKNAAKNGNDLASNFPELLEEWNYEKNVILPSEVSVGSEKKVWWICKTCGNIWETLVSVRTKFGCGCPECGFKKLSNAAIKRSCLDGNDLASNFPELMIEWNYNRNKVKPSEISKGSNRIVWWICSVCGNEYECRVADKISSIVGCSQCKKETKSSFPEQAIYYYLKQVYTEVINGNKDLLDGKLELDIYIPEIKTGIEYDGLNWHKHRLEKDIEKNNLCLEKGIKLIRIREEGLLDVMGSINIFCDGSNLSNVLDELFSLFGVEVDVNIERDRQEIYSQYIQSKKENSLAVKFPEIAKEWHPTKNGTLTPENVTYGSGKRVWWLCDKGHEWVVSVGKRTTRGDNCPYCAGQQVLKGFNDLCTTHPELVKEWNFEKNGDLTPDMVSRGCNKKVWWKCSVCNYEWLSTVGHRTSGRTCPVCSKISMGKKQSLNSSKKGNDLASNFPDLLKEWDYSKNDVLPFEVSQKSNKKAWWVCQVCGYEWSTRIANRTIFGHGCKMCGIKKAWETRHKNKDKEE